MTQSLLFLQLHKNCVYHISASIMASSSGKTTCYGSYGSKYAVVPGALPCNPQAEVSTCCGFTETCYSNGLCAPGPGLPNWGPNPYYTGYCTDRSWSNGTACPSVCNNQPSGEFRRSTCALCRSLFMMPCVWLTGIIS